MMKVKLSKKIWEVVKKIPAVSYGIISILLFIFIGFALGLKPVNLDSETPNIFLVIGFVIFAPSFLLCTGIGHLMPNNISEIISETAPFIIFISVCLTLDLTTYLIHKALAKLFGQNLFTKITTIILTIILWIIVFAKLIDSLPIDT